MKFPLLLNSRIGDYKVSGYGRICPGKMTATFLRLCFTSPVIWICVQLGFRMFAYYFEPAMVLEA